MTPSFRGCSAFRPRRRAGSGPVLASKRVRWSGRPRSAPCSDPGVWEPRSSTCTGGRPGGPTLGWGRGSGSGTQCVTQGLSSRREQARLNAEPRETSAVMGALGAHLRVPEPEWREQREPGWCSDQ